jgi:branched-chain amino acid transport system permease protein
MPLEFILYHAGFVGIAIQLALSLNYVWRANLFSFGHFGFFSIGAYAAVMLAVSFFPSEPDWFVTSASHRAVGALWLLASILVGALAGGVAAAVVGKLFASIRGDYFAVATLIFAEAVQRVIANWPYVGGSIGANVPYLVWTNSGEEHLYYVSFYAAIALTLAGLLFWLGLRTERSVIGLWLNAVRDDELASEFSGIDVKRLQLYTFTAGGAVAGAAGALFLHMTTFVTPTDFSFIASIPVILYVVLGNGMPLRCTIVTVLLYGIYELIKLRFLGFFGSGAGEIVNDWRDAILGVVLVLSAAAPPLLRGWNKGGVR